MEMLTDCSVVGSGLGGDGARVDMREIGQVGLRQTALVGVPYTQDTLQASIMFGLKHIPISAVV